MDENQVSEEPKAEDLALVYDVPVRLTVELGNAIMTIGDVLKCGKGSIIPLSQKVGDPFKIYLEEKPLAEGEIVEAGDYLGIKITNIIKLNPEDAS
jgi:flagellar motor switch protein FliN/FliY